MESASFPCFGSFLVMCEYWNFWVLIQIVKDQTHSFWSEWTFRTFSEYTCGCFVHKTGFTSTTETLGKAYLMGLLPTDHSKLCMQFVASVSVACCWRRSTFAVSFFVQEKYELCPSLWIFCSGRNSCANQRTTLYGCLWGWWDREHYFKLSENWN